MSQKVVLNVEGMSCDHCVHTIEGNVGELSGVESVKVYLKEGKVDVAFDADVVDLNKIKEVIEDSGYEVGESANSEHSHHEHNHHGHHHDHGNNGHCCH